MRKIVLIMVGAAILTITSLVRAGDMGNMGGMGQNGSMQNTNSNDSTLKSYPAKGIVKKITPDRHTATIDTDEIPGYMDKMTMDYPVVNTNELKGISSGDAIRFTLVVSTNADWIEGIHRMGHFNGGTTNSMPVQ